MDIEGNDESTAGRYEFRVWGRHRKASQMLARLADSSTRERVDDCYLLVDDPSWNAKIRGNSVKIKQMVAERKGFEHWVSGSYRAAESAPSPFDEVFDELALDRLLRAAEIDFSKVIDRIDPDSGTHAVVVSKDRRRYTIGDVRAESTTIDVHATKEVLDTLVIEGDDLDALKALRKQLGIRGEDNVAVHQALAAEVGR